MPVSSLTAPRRPTPGGLLSLEDAAAYLQIAPGTLKHWIALKRIEHVKVGKFTRFTQAALDRFIAAQTVAADAV
jgi:excisionase family DNA binding protein